jgi:hypothetical protein
VLAVPVDESEHFYELLVGFYETDDSSKLKQYLYDNALEGMVFADREAMAVAIELALAQPCQTAKSQPTAAYTPQSAKAFAKAALQAKATKSTRLESARTKTNNNKTKGR